MKPIQVFYHLNDMPGWDNVFRSQWSKISNSGLRSAADRIFLCFNGSSVPELLKQVSTEHSNVVLEHVSDSFHKAEYPTLNFLHTTVLHNKTECNVLYVHLKGLTQLDNPAVTDWRNLMDYGCIECWRAATNELRNFDVCGVNWIPTLYVEEVQNFIDDRHQTFYNRRLNIKRWSQNHFNGNFWWATSEYIRKLNPLLDPSTVSPGDISPLTGEPYTKETIRMDCEYWVGSQNPRWSSLINTVPHMNTDGSWHYKNPYPESNYRNKPLQIDRYPNHPIRIE